MLNRMLVHPGVDEKKARLATRPTEPPRRVELISGAEGPRLELQDRFDCAWRRLGMAMDRAGSVVGEGDRPEAIYDVQAAAPEEKADDDGWLSELFADNERPTKRPFRIRVTSRDAVTDVAISAGEGGPLNGPAAEVLLSRLEEQLC